MSLDEYKKKRDFTKSPEPAGESTQGQSNEPGAAGRVFCVQKHLASQLHYDLRLEHRGVLLSWAIPKGPSINNRDKRLAVHVEDHPIDYRKFEGVIHEGYGAGIVMLWDTGTWTPDTDDVDSSLRKGTLRFTLNGTKLKGSWVLVKTGWSQSRNPSKRKNNSWLLIKNADEWSNTIDITTSEPLSIESLGKFEDILAADSRKLRTSNRLAKSGSAKELLDETIKRAETIRSSYTATAQTKIPSQNQEKENKFSLQTLSKRRTPTRNPKNGSSETRNR